MTEILMLLLGAAGGGVFAAYRLKGSASLRDTLRRVVPFGGGGPKPTK